DSRRGSLFFFGGGTNLPGNDPHDDLWEQRGTHWRQYVSSPTPTSRTHAAMAYDAKRDELVLVGGLTGSVFTWHDGVWTLQGFLGLREDPALAYDPVREVVIMFGG